MMRNSGKNQWVLLALILAGSFSSFKLKKMDNAAIPASIKLVFINRVNGSKIVFNDSTYSNSFGEKYTITKLRYYVTNVALQNQRSQARENNSYHLIDESKPTSGVINFFVPGGDYAGLQFLLGVDSLHNVSGAQTGDLDPANDMFWTWNTGYVMAKMEGNSSSSKQVNNKFEYHIGGFSGPFNVLKPIMLNFPEESRQFLAGKKYEIIVTADINTWWQHPNDIKIAEHAVITSPGKLAKELSDNYANMFHIEKIGTE